MQGVLQMLQFPTDWKLVLIIDWQSFTEQNLDNTSNLLQVTSKPVAKFRRIKLLTFGKTSDRS